MISKNNKKTKPPRVSIGEEESKWYFEQLQEKQRYSMFLHNDASQAAENEAYLNNTDFWFED